MFYFAAMDSRAERIVDTAIELAERDGYVAVRLRDVAAQAGVALGTVYRRFTCKEDILAAALEREVNRLRARAREIARNDSLDPRARVDAVFELLTRGLLRRQNLTRALLRAVASGEPDITQKVTRFHSVITRIVLAAIRGEPYAQDVPDDQVGTETERTIAMLLQQVWFASLVGWSSGMHDGAMVIQHIRVALRYVFPQV